MSADEGDLIFTGGSAEEAEDFIFAVKKRAYSKGKHKDNVWIAEYVSICFAKKALRWYEDLDKETQNDWDLLKRAILNKYTEAELPSSMIPTSAPITPSSVPNVIAAAAPPIRTGRIRVESESIAMRGYIAKPPDNNSLCIIASDRSAAAIFYFDTAARTIKYQGTPDDYLIVRACQTKWKLERGSNHHAGIFKNQGRSVVRKSGWSNDFQVDLWSMVNESKLVGRWPLEAGGFWELEGSANSAKQLYLVPDSNEFLRVYGGLESLTLHFESLA